MDQARISPLFSHDVDPVRFTRGISQPGIVEWKRAWGRTVRRRRQGQGRRREGKGRETRERRKGSFGCRRKEKHFAAAFLSHARCKIHRITPTACSYHGEEGEGESEKERREGGREKGFPTYVHQNFFIARSLARRRRRHHGRGRWLFRWLWGIKAGELGTIARGCCCGVNWGLLESNDGELARAAPKTQKSFTENP